MVLEHVVDQTEVRIVDTRKVLTDIHVRDSKDLNLVVQHLMHGELVNARLVVSDGCHRVPCRIELQLWYPHLFTDNLQTSVNSLVEAGGILVHVVEVEHIVLFLVPGTPVLLD